MNVKSFIFGAVLGSCVTGVATYFITKNKLEHQCQEEIAEMREHYISQYLPHRESLMKEHEKPAPEAIVGAYRTSDERMEYDRAELERPSEEDDVEDAPDNYYEAENPEGIEAMNDDLSNIEYQRNNERKDPEIIVESEFGTHGFDTQFLTIYLEDMAIIDSQEQIIDDPRDILGICLETSGFLEDEDTENELFVRNFRYGTDYSIVKNTGSWDGYVKD